MLRLRARAKALLRRITLGPPTYQTAVFDGGDWYYHATVETRSRGPITRRRVTVSAQDPTTRDINDTEAYATRVRWAFGEEEPLPPLDEQIAGAVRDVTRELRPIRERPYDDDMPVREALAKGVEGDAG